MGSWLRATASLFFCVAAVASFLRYGKSKSSRQLLISCAFLLAAGIFAYLALS